MLGLVGTAGMLMAYPDAGVRGRVGALIENAGNQLKSEKCRGRNHACVSDSTVKLP